MRIVLAIIALLGAALLSGCDRMPQQKGVAPVNPPPPPSAANSPPEPYDLSERCGRTAREWFKQFYGTGETKGLDSQTTTGYENHYNAKLKKCFALVQSNTNSKDTKTGISRYSLMRILADVNENKTMGTLFE